MVIVQKPVELRLPVDISSKDFARNKYEYYRQMREQVPVCQGKISFLKAYFLSRYEDCVSLAKDSRFVRNRTNATGGGRLPFPVPKAVTLLSQNMLTEDEPDHRRLRNLVQQAFTQGQLNKLEARIEAITNQLLDRILGSIESGETVDIKLAYALPIPVTVIQEMIGVAKVDMPIFREGMAAMKDGFSGWAIAKTLLWDMPRLSSFIRELIARKRTQPQDDLLTGLIQAEEEGARLSEDELVSMVFLLIVAGYETTVQLITNGVLTLLQHPQQLEKLRAQPELMGSAVEEILRFAGPIHSTKPEYALRPVTLHGVTIPKGAAVFPLLGSANRDPAIFENPEVFDIERSPNKHLGFGSGIHACLGAPLARMETRIALRNLLQRSSNLRLAVDSTQLEIDARPAWHTYKQLPVVLAP